MNPLAITSIGMCTALGRNAVHSCASARAGLSRFSYVDSAVRKTCSIDDTRDSFWSDQRWLEAALTCLQDLRCYGQLPDEQDDIFWQRTALVWALPTLERLASNPDLGDVHELIQDHSKLPLAIQRDWACFGNHVASPQAIRMAYTLLQNEDIDRVIVMAMDSPAHSGDFIPGEAVAAILLEPAATARKPEAYLSQLALGEAIAPIQRDVPKLLAPQLACAWQQTISTALSSSATSGSQELFVGNLYHDFNGEPWRAATWGFVLPKLSRRIDFDRSPTHSYAAAFGEIGAAGALCGICLATRSFVRNYAGHPQAMVCSLANDGQTSAILLTDPKHNERAFT